MVDTSAVESPRGEGEREVSSSCTLDRTGCKRRGGGDWNRGQEVGGKRVCDEFTNYTHTCARTCIWSQSHNYSHILMYVHRITCIYSAPSIQRYDNFCTPTYIVHVSYMYILLALQSPTSRVKHRNAQCDKWVLFIVTTQLQQLRRSGYTITLLSTRPPFSPVIAIDISGGPGGARSHSMYMYGGHFKTLIKINGVLLDM